MRAHTSRKSLWLEAAPIRLVPDRLFPSKERIDTITVHNVHKYLWLKTLRTTTISPNVRPL